ncbi:hypothetical protein ABZ436_16395 [Micromonospora matsumotoense]|uniref:hypothetical protein n=1 Tax=Micromonospora matsumotoense TaxID=121616 RepID=UPI00340A3F73
MIAVAARRIGSVTRRTIRSRPGGRGSSRSSISWTRIRAAASTIPRTAGTSLAAIGYHFRTTRALLDQALFEAMEDWGQELERAFTVDAGPDATLVRITGELTG